MGMGENNMQLNSIFSCVVEDLKSETKEDIIKEMVSSLVESGKIKESDKEDIIKAFIDREKISSTGIGEGVAVPHTKHKSANSLVGAFGYSKKGIDFYSLDGNPVHFFFLLLSPTNRVYHLEVLDYIAHLVRTKRFEKCASEVNHDNIIELLGEGELE